MHTTITFKFRIVSILFILMISFYACGENDNSKIDNNKTDSDTKENNTDNTSPDKSLENIFKGVLNEDKYETHYYGQWDIETNYPYDNLDEFYEDAHYGYFKFFFNKEGKIIQHVRVNQDLPERIADYKYNSDGSFVVSWTKNYDYKTGAHNKLDIIEYYSSGRIKSLSEYNIDSKGKKELRMKSTYTDIDTGKDFPSNKVKYFNAKEKELVYAITEFQKNVYTDEPKYLKLKETLYISFGDYKDKWFTINRYDDTGEVIRTQQNETKTDDGMILPDYIKKEFPEMFSN